MSEENKLSAVAENPHWIGNKPAWDIKLTNGEIHKDITDSEISLAMRELRDRGLIGNFEFIADVVRQQHINFYNQFHTLTC